MQLTMSTAICDGESEKVLLRPMARMCAHFIPETSVCVDMTG